MSVKREILGAGLALLGTAAYVVWKRLGKERAPAQAPVPTFEIHPRLMENSAADQRRLIAAAPPAPVTLGSHELSLSLPYTRTAPHEFPEFGHDLERNSDDISLDDYLTMPLEGSGQTHENRTKFVDLDAEEPVAPAERFRFVRLKVLETRDLTAGKVCLGGLKLLWGTQVINLPGTTAWNPHTGVRKPWLNGASTWTDADQYELVLCFPHAVSVTRYQFRSSLEEPAYDPRKWRLEGSQNGTFWLALDDRSGGEFVPEERGVWMNYRCSGLPGLRPMGISNAHLPAADGHF